MPVEVAIISMETLISILFVLVGLINFVPVIGLLSNAKVSSLYEVDVSDTNTAILLRHRALLFGILGGVISYSAFYKELQPLAFVMGFASMIGYAALCIHQGNTNRKLKRVLNADWLAIALFSVALLLRLFS